MYEEFTGLTYEEAKHYCATPTENMKPHDRKIIELMIRSAKEVGGTILDVGCGPGRLAGVFNIDKYVGIDVSPVLVKVAMERYPEHTFMVMNAEKMKFKNKSFDNVVCGGVLPHMPSEKIAVDIIKEMVRVTKKLLQITWSTPPGCNTEINHVTGHFGRQTYQNRYSRSRLVDLLPKKSKLDEGWYNGCSIWRIWL